eukprot:jgi/Chlat1/164/Chrsp1S03245
MDDFDFAMAAGQGVATAVKDNAQGAELSIDEEDLAGICGISLDEDAVNELLLFRCIEEDKLETVHALLDRNLARLDTFNDKGLTPLQWAVYHFQHHRKPDTVRFLLDKGADPLQPCSTSSNTATPHTIGYTLRDPRYAHYHLEPRAVHLKAHTTALALALELQASLQDAAWEFAHFDAVLRLLCAAAVQRVDAKERPPQRLKEVSVASHVVSGWKAVFDERSDPAQVCIRIPFADDIIVLRSLVEYCSPVLASLLSNVDQNIREPITGVSAAAAESVASWFFGMTVRPPVVLELDPAVTGVRPQVVRCMLQWMYTGQVDDHDMHDLGPELMLASHKFKVVDLMEVCAARIMIRVGNVAMVLNAATSCGVPYLVRESAVFLKGLYDAQEQGPVSGGGKGHAHLGGEKEGFRSFAHMFEPQEPNQLYSAPSAPQQPLPPVTPQQQQQT